jgi:hypothetical protein
MRRVELRLAASLRVMSLRQNIYFKVRNYTSSNDADVLEFEDKLRQPEMC